MSTYLFRGFFFRIVVEARLSPPSVMGEVVRDVSVDIGGNVGVVGGAAPYADNAEFDLDREALPPIGGGANGVESPLPSSAPPALFTHFFNTGS